MMNLCCHTLNFKLHAHWIFFATPHSKSLSNEIRGTMKTLVHQESLQHSTDNQILIPLPFFDFCKTKIQGISFYFIGIKSQAKTQNFLIQIIYAGSTIAATRSFHYLNPIKPNTIGCKHVSSDDKYSVVHTFLRLPNYTVVKPIDYTVFRYN